LNFGGVRRTFIAKLALIFKQGSQRFQEMIAPDEKPPRIAPSLKSAPRVRQLYWCEFPKDAHLPEFWKTRPVLVISFRNALYGAVTVVPCTTQAQPDNKWAVKLSVSIEDDTASWAMCDKPTTVAVSRLKNHRGDIKRLTEDEFNPVLAKVLAWLPKPPA
jgi:mRNA interferase MazF